MMTSYMTVVFLVSLVLCLADVNFRVFVNLQNCGCVLLILL